MSDFSTYETDTLLKVHANLERGIDNAVAVFASGGAKAGYAADSYHLTLHFLAVVEDELDSRGVDPHA